MSFRLWCLKKRHKYISLKPKQLKFDLRYFSHEIKVLNKALNKFTLNKLINRFCEMAERREGGERRGEGGRGGRGGRGFGRGRDAKGGKSTLLW